MKKHKHCWHDFNISEEQIISDKENKTSYCNANKLWGGCGDGYLKACCLCKTSTVRNGK